MTPREIIAVEELAAVLPINAQSGLTFDATGRLIVNTADEPQAWLNGLPVRNTGSLCIVMENTVATVLTTAPTASTYEADLYDD